MIQEVAEVIGLHPKSDIMVGVPLAALIIWAGKILYTVTVAQKEMMATLFGSQQAPGAIPRFEKMHESHRRKIANLRGEIHTVALKAGINNLTTHEDNDDD